MPRTAGQRRLPPLPQRRWTLRTRLVVSIVALVALACFGIGAASIIGLNQYLEQRVDTQLAAALSRTLDASGGSGFPDREPQSSEFVLAPGLPVGTVAAVVVDGRVVNSLRLTVGESIPLTEAANTALLGAPNAAAPGAREPQTVSVGELGDYRALSVTTRSGANFIVGLPLAEVEAIIGQFRSVVILISALGLLVAALASGLIVSLALRPLRRVAATATQVASLPLAHGDVSLAIRVPEEDTDPHTEVGKVGAALNGMLGHIDVALRSRQASENKVRQFVADASHELRTPLASIRGYAELTRRGGYDLPPDVRHSMARVESEAVRMTSLVEDLLLLARLDAGRAMEEKPVDLSRLVVDCMSDAHAAGPDHAWVLDLPEGDVAIPGDDQRIHQVIANLLANARVHTPATTTVTVSLRVENGSAVISVEDDGPGISKAQQPSLFERFARGDTSRSRAAGSTGLGLAIVRAVVEAHAGEVSVSSRPGRTVFEVTLPGVLPPVLLSH